MNIADYKAARERMRRVDGGEDRLDVYGGIFASLGGDKLIVYDCEHDATPATVEWLREVGFDREKRTGNLRCGKLYGVVRFTDHGLSLMVEDIDGEQVVITKSPTRGDVLTALRLFGKKGST